jgi:hypothetical protein
MDNVTKLVRSYHYELPIGLLANQVITDCEFLWVHCDSTVTARGELLVFGTYDLEITIAENHRNVAHHYVRYRTEAFREWLQIPGLAAADASGVKVDVQVTGTACEAAGEELTVTLEVQAVVRVREYKSAPVAGEPQADDPSIPETSGMSGGATESRRTQRYAHFFDDLEELRAYVRRQVRGKVDVLSLDGVQVVTDGETGVDEE